MVTSASQVAGPDNATPAQGLTLSLAKSATLSADTVMRRMGSQPSGLSSVEASQRLRSVGRNVLATRTVTVWGVLIRQLRNPLLLLMLAAAGVSSATGGVTDGGIIAAIVALSVGLGFTNEYRSERAVTELHSRITHTTIAWRDGVAVPIDVRDLVPGDVVDIRLGDIVPADLRLIEATHLECDEAVFTGESTSAAKRSGPSTSDSDVDLASCTFMGTVVHQGSGRGVVVATGSDTEFGRIAVGLSEEQAETAFQTGLRDFSRFLVGVAGVLTVSIFVVNVVLSRPLIEALLFSLAIAIGITPQLLPAIVSVSLSAGSRALARRHVLVKRLVVIEDLGNIQVLFTDKTGTLTEGSISFDTSLDVAGRPSEEPFLLGLLCNEARQESGGPVGGNDLDRSMWAAPLPATATDPTSGLGAYSRLALTPFDHDRQLVSVVVRLPAGAPQLIAKGAPEAILARCTTVPTEAPGVVEMLFNQGARVVAVARREIPTDTTGGTTDEHDLTLVGFLTFVDRPKLDAGTAIARLERLGIAVKIITGDNGAVARKICADIGIAMDGLLTGAELAELDDDAVAAAIPGTTVFSRVSPEQKARIIKIARRDGTDVGFLGDGVNDAMALHAADVGISVQTATDVAKDAADIVLLDKDLGVLAEGVADGRRIFANTLKYVLMATSSNFGNMFSAAGASLFLGFLPMLPSQILLNNLLYDVGQLAIPTDRVDPEVVARPAAWDVHFIRRFMAVFGPISSIFDFATFFVMLKLLHASHAEFRSGWFVESLATQTLVIFLIRTRRVPFFRSRPSRAMVATPIVCATVGAALPFTPLAHTLGFTPLPWDFFLILLGMVVVYMGLVEFAKRLFYGRHQPAVAPPRSPTQRHHRRVRRRAGRFGESTVRRVDGSTSRRFGESTVGPRPVVSEGD